MQFATWMQGQLRRHEWLPADLARRMNVSTGTISHWLNGSRRPSSQSCDLIADAFGVDPEVVLTLVGHLPPTTEVKPDDRRAELCGLLRRVKLTPERATIIEGVFRSMLDHDRASQGSVAQSRG